MAKAKKIVKVTLDEAVVVEDPELEEIVEDEDMNPSHPEWTKYVLSEMLPDEKVNGCPTTDGLRRVCERVLGRITHSSTDVIDFPRLENERRATVRVTLQIQVGRQASNDIISVDGTADVYWGNTEKPFRNYPVATAETRAEGRALRRALRLSKVVVAEEMGATVDHDYEPGDATEGCISSTQVAYLDNMGKKLDLNLKAVIKDAFPDVKNVVDVKHSDFASLQEKINDYQRDMNSISKEFKGYDSDWRS